MIKLKTMRKILTTTIKKSLIDEATKAAKQMGISRSRFVEMAIQDKLDSIGRFNNLLKPKK